MNRVRISLGLAAACLITSGCSNGPRLGESKEPLAVTQLASLPAPQGVDPTSGAFDYRISALDKLSLIVADTPELTGAFRVDGAGRIVLPYIGSVDAAGMTSAELSAAVAERLRTGKFIRQPQVAVNVDEAEGLVYTVDGQVNEPGDYAAAPNLTLMRAVAKAKGLNEYARLDDIVLFRTVNGQSFAALYNLDAIRHGLYKDPHVYPHDMIVVGDSVARRKLQQFVASLPLLTTPIVLALQRIP